MTVSVKRNRSGRWIADIQLRWWDDSYYRERKSVPCEDFEEAKRWAKAREQHLLRVGPANAKLAAAQPIPTVTPQKGWIYFIRGYDRMIKIGWARDVARRLCTLQISAPVKLVVLRVTPGSMSEEKALHGRFAYLNVMGEWFKPGEELVEFIRHFESPPGGRRPVLRKASAEFRGLVPEPEPPPRPAKEVSPWLLCKPHGRQHCVACYAPKYGVAPPSPAKEK